MTSDGAAAFARWDGLAGVRAIDLETGELFDISLPGVPTDIDLSSSDDRLVAVVRETSQIAVMDLPEGFPAPPMPVVDLIDCSPLVVGLADITPDGQQVLAFTNATNQKAR